MYAFKFGIMLAMSVILVIVFFSMLGLLFALIKVLACLVGAIMLALAICVLYEVFFSGPGDDWGVW